LPAQIIERSNSYFKSATAAAGLNGVTSVAGHSDFTYPAVLGTIYAAKERPIDELRLESPRSEEYVREVVARSPNTQVTVVQPAQGDLWTTEAQGRAMQLQPGAYRATIDAFKNIDATNYRLVLIDNPIGIRFGIPASHGDAADYERPSQVSIFSGGQKIGSDFGKLGDLLANTRSLSLPGPSNEAGSAISRGGVYLATTRPGGEVRLVYPLFGCIRCAGH
jgi:hypothetical protein